MTSAAHAAEFQQLEGATDNQMAVAWILGSVVSKANQLREYWTRLFDASRNQGKPVAPAENVASLKRDAAGQS